MDLRSTKSFLKHIITVYLELFRKQQNQRKRKAIIENDSFKFRREF